MSKGKQQQKRPDATGGDKYQHAILVGVDSDGERHVAALDMSTGVRRESGPLGPATAYSRYQFAVGAFDRYLNNGNLDKGDLSLLDSVGQEVDPNA